MSHQDLVALLLALPDVAALKAFLREHASPGVLFQAML